MPGAKHLNTFYSAVTTEVDEPSKAKVGSIHFTNDNNNLYLVSGNVKTNKTIPFQTSIINFDILMDKYGVPLDPNDETKSVDDIFYIQKYSSIESNMLYIRSELPRSEKRTHEYILNQTVFDPPLPPKERQSIWTGTDIDGNNSIYFILDENEVPLEESGSRNAPRWVLNPCGTP
jgi:hypothetical protein